MRKYIVTFFTVLTFVIPQKGTSQYTYLDFAAHYLFGEETRFVIHDSDIGYSFTDKTVSVIELQNSIFVSVVIYTAPNDVKVLSASRKSNDRTRILVLLSNGTRLILHEIQTNVWFNEQTIPDLSTRFFGAKKIVGDALYILVSGKIYVSRDTAKTWAVDSTNLGTDFVQDVAVDSLFYAWAATQGKKLYYQHPDSNVWRQNTSFTISGFPYAVFVDRKGRIFVSSSSSLDRVQVSTNRGVTWSNISTGADETILSFGDDAFGNIYAVGQGTHAYRLSNLTPPWISIGDSITAQSYLPSTGKVINSIGGDTKLHAATLYGIFESTDFGANWVHSQSSLQPKAFNIYSPVVRAGNYFFISTNLGVNRVALGDSSWERVYPKQGYVAGINALTSDSAGNVYGDFPFKISPSTTSFYTVKSTDHGTSWIVDSAGQKALGFNAQTLDYTVDAQGTQYLSGNAILYTKKPGQSWKIDTAGLEMKLGEYIRQVSKNNKKGIVYVSRTKSGKFAIYSRSSGGSVWQLVNSDTLGANDAILQSDHAGNLIVKVFTTAKIWRYDGIKWSVTLLPTGLGFSPNPEWLTVDKNGVIWASFTANTSPTNKGVYFTADNGATWKYVGLLGAGVRFLTADRDSLFGQTPHANGGQTSAEGGAVVYAVTYLDGVYGFTTSSVPTSVGEQAPHVASTFELSQNYPNPFNPSTHLQFTISNLQFVQLKIFDVLGREVAVLVNEEKSPGKYTVEWNAARFSSGVYFYTLKAGGFFQTRKMLVIK